MDQYNHYHQLITAVTPSLSPESQPPHILLVEDNPLLQKVHTALLKDLGYNIVVASTGQEALKALHSGLALILMDIGLPDISGIDITCYIRSQQGYQQLPIIALTAYPKEMIAEQCHRVGINAIVSKPLPMSDLANLVQHWLRQNRAKLN